MLHQRYLVSSLVRHDSFALHVVENAHLVFDLFHALLSSFGFDKSNSLLCSGIYWHVVSLCSHVVLAFQVAHEEMWIQFGADVLELIIDLESQFLGFVLSIDHALVLLEFLVSQLVCSIAPLSFTLVKALSEVVCVGCRCVDGLLQLDRF